MASPKKQIARATRAARESLQQRAAMVDPATGPALRQAKSKLGDGDANGVAELLAPLLSDPKNEPLIRALFADRAPAFDAEADSRLAALDKAGALDAARLAWLLAPSAARGIKVVTLLRDAADHAEARVVLDEVARRFPKEPSLALQQALLKLESGEGAAAVDDLWAYMSARKAISASDRRLMARVLRAYARQCHAAGMDAGAAPHPLVEPEIAMVYNDNLADNIARWSNTPFAARQFSDNIERHDRRAAAAPPSAGRPVRVLFVTAGNWHFLTNILERWDRRASAFEPRTFDLSGVVESMKDDIHLLFAPQSMGVNDADVWRRITEAAPQLAELIAWSDVVVCEWAGVHALWLSRYLPASTRLVVRLHSYEVFSQWPLFMNWGGVDGVIFVADHIRQFATRQYGLDRYRWLKTPVVPNFNHLDRFRISKRDEARRTLGLLGYASRNKDPLFAAQTLALLAAKDADWRLRLVGSPWRNDAGVLDQAYRAEFDAFVQANGLADRITYVEFTDDLASEMETIGFVLSTSWREGTHESVLEGMAAGSIPVIRRWPMTQMFGAPASVYPDLEYCDDPAEAVEIIEKYATVEAFNSRALEMRDYAMARFDMEAVLPAFEAFIWDMSHPAIQTEDAA